MTNPIKNYDQRGFQPVWAQVGFKEGPELLGSWVRFCATEADLKRVIAQYARNLAGIRRQVEAQESWWPGRLAEADAILTFYGTDDGQRQAAA